ncbi:MULTISPECIES: class I SAM-dependent methyltransferase [unclassified Crossiella]|uniref:class I SAM-dependent methyltransferase n=1 Tax=unclassified Crossiella TaxID=2620835 RepID=UPI001FFED23E|nr:MULTISPECIES: class I SAM-dependent methyltransferase [unclassified Crossiella]MCK2243753.1 class I SAM-dependent methyltransferase [Crossiella sp. S99.2]MCK2257612.1 class I SAM-dependent methyltransferase [Crossiella sp. S99.1]
MSTDLSRLISAAGGHPADLTTVINEVGPPRCTEIAADEIAYRLDPPRLDPDTTIEVQLHLSHHNTATDHLVTITDAGATHTQARSANPHATIHQDLGELLRQLLGPRNAAGPATRQVELRDSGNIESFRRPPVAFAATQRLLATLDHRDQPTLTELASRHESDKWGIHQYTQHYPRYLEPLRDRPLTVLEIGIGGFDNPTAGGASLRMWKHYFPRATIYGVDVHDKTPHAQQRIHILRADQSDPQALQEVVARTGPLDIVIDDGSHQNAHVLTTFHTLFPHVRDGGYYAIEDLQTSYWPRFGGTSEDFTSPHTSLGFLKTLVDGLNHEEVLTSSPRDRAPTDRSVRSLHFHHNLAVIEKGVNLEGGGPDWVRYGPR